MTGVSVRRSAIRFRRAAGALVLLLSIGCIAASAAEEPPPLAPSLAEMVPVLRPATENAAAQPVSFGMPLLSFWQAESAFQAGQAAEALSRFLDLAYGAPDDERKGFVWMRVGDLLLSRREYQQALEAADKAVSLSRGRFLVLSSMELKFRIYRALRRMPEARQVAASLLAQHYVLAEPVELLAVMARADASGGNLPRGLDEFRRAIAAARSPEEAADLRKEREALIDALASIPALREAAEEEEEAEVKGHLYLVLGRHAARMGYPGMGAFALGQAARAGGERGEEAARQLYRLEQIIASRPKIVGILPLSGKHADIGFAILTGAEVALRRAQGETSDLFFPVMRWRDSAARPEEARREYEAAARDGTVVGILGPLTGEEGYSVSMIFGPVSPPVLYLGQKAIPEKPFLFRFGLTPIQEARAVLEHFSRQGAKELLLFHPTNGYGEGFADAVRTAAKEQGIVLSKTVSYDPDTNDFTEAIRKAVGSRAFSEHSGTKEKGKAMQLSVQGIVIADRWDKLFLLASQLRYYNVYLPMAGFSGGISDELIRRGGEAVNGAVFSLDYADALPGPQGDRFRKNFREGMGYAPSRFEAVGYDGATLLSEAYRLESWKEESRPAGVAVREWLPTMKTFRGVTGLFRFGPSGEMYRDLSLMRVESRRLVPVAE
ncbi:MAG: hypothetical protein A2X88_05285 [Deltaproteobacteria bacterium GWC2_65_14]|nr:MAG: hypothetical protein A2X88_05285 [Deltaproteobacteria bacterium GWC2_65_14]